MSFLDLINHLLNFVAPALFVALGLSAAARWLIRRTPGQMAWWKQWVVLSAAGALVLLLGLILLGRDGRMGSYAALVVVCATVQWLLLRGWKR
ncbi:hypothetical protein PGB34_10065 [Xenophilus arseniciresistens]|uniref:Uncharacterized protein n=1 Tax=Xenophilus arseniciresistens TaxID=1283306 RepID=A0AAE3N8W7_9BURK|nr:hypothetical protein [Xenophilus arseniciresistens]MDA7416709.1 hypothetical protein [Xenophilus arseniciresistens]